MKRSFFTWMVFLLALAGASGAHAALTDLATAPLASSSSTTVRPNLMFILDDSGSMGWDYLPDNVADANVCKVRCTNSSCSATSTGCQAGEPPYYASAFNYIYYNPQITYTPGVNYDGTSMGSQGSPWTAVKSNPYTSPASTTNLVTNYPEIVYCQNWTDSATAATCRRNGIDTASPFLYDSAAANGFPNGTAAGAFRFAKTRNGAPYYFTVAPREHCSDVNLTTCIAASAPSGAYTFPAPVRYCKTTADAAGAAPVSGNSGGTPRCQSKYSSTYKYPRYGNFTRTDIVPATPTYGGRPDRTDCAAAPNCTYAEEMTNFANWYAYYRIRILMMKTAAGQAFLPVDDKYRVGFVTINPGSPVSANKYLKIDKFTATQRQNWYAKLYSQAPGASTPLREALSRVGRHYAGRTDGINQGMSDDPVQYSCQQNFSLLTTDGYWNGNAGVQLNGTTTMGNQDNVNSGYSTRAIGAYDGGLAGATGTLADVAMYYYKSDLRPSGSTGALGTDVSADNVPVTAKDSAPFQHMTTFTLGLGLDGKMNYQSDYETNATGDFAKIKAGGTNTCSWTTGTCNWPVPAANSDTALDDLWHAAVNGRGTYFSARDPGSLTDGLASALAGLTVRIGAAAASATSSPNITQTDNFIYSTTYRTVKWDGEVVAQQIDTQTGNVSAAIQWSAQALLDGKVSANSDTRTIYTFDAAAASRLKPFQWSDLSAAEQAYFSNKCAALSQCPGLNAGEKAQANSGKNLLEYVRGQKQYENPVFRAREHVLGDPVNAIPAYIKAPRFDFGDAVAPDYATFKAGNTGRQAVLYIAANDGMLHAFNADSGQEMWAYAPKIVMPNLYKLAEENYATAHQYFVDGSPETMDIFSGGSWKTVLVGGLNSGGRGYYALDVTDPANPKALWEFCADSALCAVSDSDLGYSYGNPVITKRASDGKWVALVTSGYNNVSPGNGKGYLYVLDAATGAVLEKIGTGTGSTTTPSGLAKISAWAASANTDNTALRVYGGDLEGNVWRFDLSAAPSSVMQLGTLRDGSNKPQSITVRPELGEIQGQPVIFIGTGRYLGEQDLVDPATLVPPLPYAYQQTVYAFKDTQTNLGNIRASNMVPQTLNQTDAVTRVPSENPVDWTTNNGWYVDFNPLNLSPGERVNIDMQLVLGTLVVTTNVPNSNACTTGGDSWQYQFNFSTGSNVSTSVNRVAGRKIANALTVGNVVVRLPTGQLKIISTDASGVKQTFELDIGGTPASGKRVSWRELTQ